jgi:hypothetical protein
MARMEENKKEIIRVIRPFVVFVIKTVEIGVNCINRMGGAWEQGVLFFTFI